MVMGMLMVYEFMKVIMPVIFGEVQRDATQHQQSPHQHQPAR